MKTDIDEFIRKFYMAIVRVQSNLIDKIAFQSEKFLNLPYRSITHVVYLPNNKTDIMSILKTCRDNKAQHDVKTTIHKTRFDGGGTRNKIVPIVQSSTTTTARVMTLLDESIATNILAAIKELESKLISPFKFKIAPFLVQNVESGAKYILFTVMHYNIQDMTYLCNFTLTTNPREHLRDEVPRGILTTMRCIHMIPLQQFYEDTYKDIAHIDMETK